MTSHHHHQQHNNNNNNNSNNNNNGGDDSNRTFNICFIETSSVFSSRGPSLEEVCNRNSVKSLHEIKVLNYEQK
jgi:hypothetical protein